MRVGRSTARTFAWIAIAGPFLFTAAWIVAGAFEPGYSHLYNAISELGGRDAANPLIVNVALVVLGLSVVALGLALPRAVPQRSAALVASLLFAGAGIALVVAGVVPLDCGLTNDSCERMWRAGELSWREDAHLWAALATQVMLVLTPFALARSLWPGPVAPLAATAGMFGVAVGVLTFAIGGAHGVADGLVQRLGLAMVHVWVIAVAAGVLHATRAEPRRGQLVSLRPRDFLAREWSGEGELVARPFVLWRRFGQRFEAIRTSTWITDRVWRIDDESRFGDGRVQRRRMFCEFVEDARIEITGGDMPDGATVQIEEEGYRVTPFRMDFPIGPVSVPIRVHDVSYVEPDGTLANSFEARSIVFGLLLARVTFRVRPTPPAPL